MKIAISVPDDILSRAELLAHRTGKSLGRIFSNALREYLARHSPSEVTEAMDRVCEKVGKSPDPFVAAASRRTLKRSDR